MMNHRFPVPQLVSDQEHLVTKEIQNVIDECRENGGGTVIIPAGEYYVASLMLYSNITLYLEKGAKLIGSTNWRDYTDFHVPSTIQYHHSQRVIEAWNLPPHYYYSR